MDKILKFIVFTFLIYAAIIFLVYPNITKDLIYEILNLWLTKVLVALLPFYILSNLLLQYPIISNFLYPILNKIMRFENKKACSLFLISFITGNPTSSILVINSVTNKEISTQEGNRLLRCTVLSSPLFTISMTVPYGWYVLLSAGITSIIFYILGYKKTENTNSEKLPVNISIFDLADQTPTIMLEILSSMVIIGLLKLPIEQLLTTLNINDLLFVKYSLDLVELTTGLNNIQLYQVSPLIKVILSSFLLSFGGITIIIQIMNQIKKTNLSKTSLVVSRILHGLCTMSILLLFNLIFRI